ncbi:MAG: NRDE family protein [Gammaproteobacteria bacterium]|nr:NRDE family protein [Gammaproteobacteria bacterium]
MCTLVFAWDRHPRYRFVFAGNRDEFHDRPTAAAHRWAGSDIVAGKDLVGGGSWLGVTTTGRFAVVTNFREGQVTTDDKRSRGQLVIDYLQSADTDVFRQQLVADAEQYSGYNLIFGDLRAALYHDSNRGQSGGINRELHGLSNHLLDTPWPKVGKAMKSLARLLQEPDLNPNELFDLLGDRSQAPTADLPDTGVGQEMEQLLSSAFIVSPTYGTRSSTVVLLDHEGRLQFCERSFERDGSLSNEEQFEYMLQ